MTKNFALQLRAALNAAAQHFSDSEAVQFYMIFPQWTAGEDYPEGYKIQYNNRVYRTIFRHIAKEDWEPDKAIHQLYEEITDA